MITIYVFSMMVLDIYNAHITRREATNGYLLLLDEHTITNNNLRYTYSMYVIRKLLFTYERP